MVNCQLSYVQPQWELCVVNDFYSLNWRVRVIVFNATFNNISVISWLSVLLVEETGVPGENHRPVASR
jgi:hypothetical protein